VTEQPGSSPPRARWKRSSATLDVAIALSFFAMMALGVVAYTPLVGAEGLPPVWVSLAIGGMMTTPLAFRRRAPRTVLALVTVAFSAFRLLEIPEWSISAFSLFVALYTVGAQLPPHKSRSPRIATVVVIGVLIVYAYTVMFDPEMLEVTSRELLVLQATEVAMNVLFAVAAWVLGDIAWRRRRAESELEQQLEEVAAGREALARQAVQEERVRIARELHDVVAHHVSVMGIQAGAARRSLARDPERASEALAGVEQASRDAVTEMQRLLTFLRSDGEAADSSMTPQPSLAELDALLDTVRETGLDVQVEIVGTQRALPSSVELSAFRIVQEALTNTLKHGQGVTRAWIRLIFEADRLRIEVHDDGTAAARSDPTSDSGRGLLGMRERAALHGGELTISARPGGGFAVEGWLPAARPADRTTAPA
jgi:signal transduction histidine kinase